MSVLLPAGKMNGATLGWLKSEATDCDAVSDFTGTTTDSNRHQLTSANASWQQSHPFVLKDLSGIKSRLVKGGGLRLISINPSWQLGGSGSQWSWLTQKCFPASTVCAAESVTKQRCGNRKVVHFSGPMWKISYLQSTTWILDERNHKPDGPQLKKKNPESCYFGDFEFSTSQSRQIKSVKSFFWTSRAKIPRLLSGGRADRDLCRALTFCHFPLHPFLTGTSLSCARDRDTQQNRRVSFFFCAGCSSPFCPHQIRDSAAFWI